MNENPTTKKVTLRMVTVTCKKCGASYKVPVVSILGKITTPEKAAAAIKNGKRGGRPEGPCATTLKKELSRLKREPKTPERDKAIAALGRTIRRRNGAN